MDKKNDQNNGKLCVPNAEYDRKDSAYLRAMT